MKMLTCLQKPRNFYFYIAKACSRIKKQNHQGTKQKVGDLLQYEELAENSRPGYLQNPSKDRQDHGRAIKYAERGETIEKREADRTEMEAIDLV